ncbi:MAG: hypothetical protein HY435_02580 [Candidatus Liptonbacteria bacterium]|nr:hypothetical protein [Candidatus Liptonbacteria bacterium]
MPNLFEMFRVWEYVLMVLFAVTGTVLIADGYRQRARRYATVSLSVEGGGIPMAPSETKRFGFRVGQRVPYSSRKHPRVEAKIVGFSERGKKARLVVATHPKGVTVRRSTRRLAVESGQLIVF